MQIAKRLWGFLAIAVISIVVDLLYSNAVKIAGQTLELSNVITVRPIILIVFYMIALMVAFNHLATRERNSSLSLSLILVGLLLILISGYPMWLSAFPRGQIYNSLADFSGRVFSSPVALTLQAGALLTAVGLLGFLPTGVFSKNKM